MIPLPHLERNLDFLKTKKRIYYFSNLLGLFLLTIIFMFVAPFLHELFHIHFLENSGVHYYTDIEFNPREGLHGKITDVLGLDMIGSVILMLVGVFGNAIIGLSILALGFIALREKMLLESNFFAYMSIGFLSDPLTYLFQDTGDLINILYMMDMTEYSFLLPALGTIFFLLSLLYLDYHVKHNVKYINDIEDELLKVEEFLDEIYSFRLAQGIQHN